MRTGCMMLFALLIGSFSIIFNATLAPARACGIGQPATMYLNAEPAVAFPGGSTSPAHPLGLFADAAVVGQRTTFTEDASGLPGFNPAAYQWRWSFGDGTSATGMIVSHVFTRPGTVLISVSLISPSGKQQSTTPFDSAQLVIHARALADPPVVRGAASTTVTGMGDAVTFDGAGSYAAVGKEIRWLWNFGDGTMAAGASVTHRFWQLGSGAVALTVMDARGATTTVFFPIRIVPQLPQPRFSVTTSAPHANQSVTFNAQASSVPPTPGNTVADYLWDFGDGAQYESQQPGASHRFRQPGIYQVTLTITDMTGLTAHITQRVTIRAAMPSSALPAAAWWIAGSSITIIALCVLSRRFQNAISCVPLRKLPVST